MSKHIENLKIKVSELVPHKDNERLHSEEQIQQIANSISDTGFYTDIIVDENKQVLIGHARLEAAKFLKLKEVPCKMIKGLSEEEKHLVRIRDNKLSDNSEFDYAKLKETLSILEEGGLELDLTGFSEFELDAIMLEDDLEEPEIDDLAEKKEIFDNAEVKRIVLMYNSEDYDSVVGDSDYLREKLGIVDNSQLFQFLVEKELGKETSKDENNKPE